MPSEGGYQWLLSLVEGAVAMRGGFAERPGAPGGSVRTSRLESRLGCTANASKAERGLRNSVRSLPTVSLAVYRRVPAQEARGSDGRGGRRSGRHLKSRPSMLDNVAAWVVDRSIRVATLFASRP